MWKNIFSSPKSTIRGLGIIGVIAAAVATQYPSARWAGVILASVAGIQELLAKDL